VLDGLISRDWRVRLPHPLRFRQLSGRAPPRRGGLRWFDPATPGRDTWRGGRKGRVACLSSRTRCGFEPRPRYSFRCRAMAAQRPVGPPVLVRLQAPEHRGGAGWLRKRRWKRCTGRCVRRGFESHLLRSPWRNSSPGRWDLPCPPHARRGRRHVQRPVKPPQIVADLGRHQGRALTHCPCPRSSEERAPPSDGGLRWFDSSRGRSEAARPNARV
jgi:hypothetical protein